MIKRTVNIFDTTLRDGEQTPGTSFTPEVKQIIARQLDKLGVDVIEAGTPVISKEECDSIRAISKEDLDVKVCGLARLVKKDIDACIDCNVDMVHLFVSTSDIQIEHTIKLSKKEIIDLAIKQIEYVKDHDLLCLFSAMDATRSDLKYLLKIFSAAEKAGADTINIPDTVGVMVPSTMRKLVLPIYESVSVPIDVHCHNDFGLAVSNSLSAVESGASQVQVTVNGIGERAGNADLAEVVMSLHSIYGAKTKIKTEHIVETSKLIERFTGIRILPNKPIVGDNAFSHESGIHAHGVIKNSETFEPGIMTPEMVGHKRMIVLGKHAGRHSVEKKLSDIGFVVGGEQLDEILFRVKELGSKGKKVTDDDLYTIAQVVIGEISKEQQIIVLDEVSVMTGNKVTSTAVIKAKVKNKECINSQTGVGPVDAALKAVRSLVKEFSVIKLRDFRIEAITGGSDALAEVIVCIEDEKGNVITAQAASDDIVMASVQALINAINRLMMVKI